MASARPLRDVFADLAEHDPGAGPADDPGHVLAAGGHADLPDGLVAEAVVNYADTAPIEVAEHLQPFVMVNSPVPSAHVAEYEPPSWLDMLSTAPVHDVSNPDPDPGYFLDPSDGDHSVDHEGASDAGDTGPHVDNHLHDPTAADDPSAYGHAKNVDQPHVVHTDHLTTDHLAQVYATPSDPGYGNAPPAPDDHGLDHLPQHVQDAAPHLDGNFGDGNFGDGNFGGGAESGGADSGGAESGGADSGGHVATFEQAVPLEAEHAPDHQAPEIRVDHTPYPAPDNDDHTPYEGDEHHPNLDHDPGHLDDPGHHQG